MTVKRTKPMTLEELWDFEDKHPVVFASPRALAEARLIAELNRVKRGRRRGRSEPRKSWVKISQIRTLSVERLSRKIGRAKPEEVELAITGLNQIVAP